MEAASLDIRSQPTGYSRLRKLLSVSVCVGSSLTSMVALVATQLGIAVLDGVSGPKMLNTTGRKTSPTRTPHDTIAKKATKSV